MYNKLEILLHEFEVVCKDEDECRDILDNLMNKDNELYKFLMENLDDIMKNHKNKNSINLLKNTIEAIFIYYYNDDDNNKLLIRLYNNIKDKNFIDIKSLKSKMNIDLK